MTIKSGVTQLTLGNPEEAARLRSEAAKNLDGWQRAQAEFINFRALITRTQAEEKERITADVLRELLSMVDNFRLMTKHVPENLAGDPWTKGVLFIGQHLEALLKKYGVKEFAVGIFDPATCEAVATVDKTGAESGAVVEIIQPGYLIGQRLLRAAKVKVAK